MLATVTWCLRACIHRQPSAECLATVMCMHMLYLGGQMQQLQSNRTKKYPKVGTGTVTIHKTLAAHKRNTELPICTSKERTMGDTHSATGTYGTQSPKYSCSCLYECAHVHVVRMHAHACSLMHSSLRV